MPKPKNYHRLSDGEKLRRWRAGDVVSRYAIQDWSDWMSPPRIDEIDLSDGMIHPDFSDFSKTHEIE